MIILVVTRPELRQWLCVDKLAVCCPPDHFGQDCKPCDALGSNGNQIIRSLPHNNPCSNVGIDNAGKICSGNGKCKGGGTRKGNGRCQCSSEYTGELCDQCSDGHYQSFKVTPAVKFLQQITCTECLKKCRLVEKQP